MSKIYPGERQALAIKVAKTAARKLGDLSTLVALELDAIDAALREIMPTDDDPDLKKAYVRIERLRELRNQMELGAFQISLTNALDEAWRRLP